MLQYLRQFIDFTQTDWVKWTPLAEFAANQAVNESTKMSSFYINRVFRPRMSFSTPRLMPEGASRAIQLSNKDGTDFANHMAEIYSMLVTNLTLSRIRQEEQANKNRNPAPAYKVGDMVFLDRKNISSAKRIAKLDNKYLGPFAIKKLLNSHAYQLDLPEELKSIDKSFHTSLLYPSPNTPLPGQTQSTPPPVSYDEQGEKLWQIEEIVNSRQVKEQFQYKVKSRGGDTTWDLLDNIVTATGSISEYEHKHPKKKRPTKEQIAAALARYKANKLTVMLLKVDFDVDESDDFSESEPESSNPKTFRKSHVG